MKTKLLTVVLLVLILACQNFDDSLGIYTDNVNTVSVPSSGSIIGGGVGYSGIVPASNASLLVNSVATLKLAIQNASVGAIIYIADGDFNFTNEAALVIDKQITLAGGRGISASSGAELRSSNLGCYPLIEVKANGVRITGLKIFGPDTEVGQYDPLRPTSAGIRIDGFNNLTVDNCELKGWTNSAIDFKNSLNGIVKNCYLHHNRYDRHGYGILLEKNANVLAEYNLFQFNRHDIAAEGWASTYKQSYEARFNLILEGGTSHNFDMHGEVHGGKVCGSRNAGYYISIHHNTFMNKNYPAVVVRGKPATPSSIEYNTFIHQTEGQAIVQECEGTEQGNCSPPVTGNCTGNLSKANNKYLGGLNTTGTKDDILVMNTEGHLIKYLSDNKEFFAAYGKIVGNGFSQYTDLLPGRWLNDGTSDLIVRTTAGEMLLFPYTNGTFYNNGGPILVGHDFHYQNYFVGDWTGDGTSDLIARTASGELHLYPFRNNTFYGHGGPSVVGNDFNYQDYFVGNWTGDGTSDLITRTTSGELHLYPFRNNTFYGHGAPFVVGINFHYQNYFVGNWNSDAISDLVTRTSSGELHFYPFANGTFYGNGGPITVGTGINYSKYLVGNWVGDGASDLIAVDANGTHHLYPFASNTFMGNNVPYNVGVEYSAIKYLIGLW